MQRRRPARSASGSILPARGCCARGVEGCELALARGLVGSEVDAVGEVLVELVGEIVDGDRNLVREHFRSDGAQADRGVAGYLASDELAGRKPGTPGHGAARDYLERWLRDVGAEPAGVSGTYRQDFAGGTNLLGILRPDGTTSGAPTVLITAHYDHLGTSCSASGTNTICNGAADNAAGVAVVIAAAEALKETIASPVALVFWDAEESGLVGSRHFAGAPPFPTAQLKLMINMDIIGLNLFRGLESWHSVIGAETGGAALKDDVAAATAASGLRVVPLSYALGHGRSDMTSFVNADYKLPIVFFSDGDGSVYHTSKDEAAYLNYEKVAAIAGIVARLATTASEPSRSYVYGDPRLRGGIVLPKFTDVAEMRAIVSAVLDKAAENELTPAKVATLRAGREKLDAIVARGVGAFSTPDAAVLAQVTQEVLATSRGLPFIP